MAKTALKKMEKPDHLFIASQDDFKNGLDGDDLKKLR